MHSGIFALLGLCAAAVAAERPNFLLIMTDDMGVGQFAPMAEELAESDFDPKFVDYVRGLKNGKSYSGAAALEAARLAMPTISTLAEHGLVFERGFSSSSLCNPSRVGLASAMHPNRFGIYRNNDVVGVDEIVLPPERILMPHFQQAGYATAHIGKWHLSGHDKKMEAQLLKEYSKYKGNKKQLKRLMEKEGFTGSVPEELNPLNNGFDYYYGYNYHQSRFFDAYNVWEGFEHAGRQTAYNTETFTGKALDFIDVAEKQHKPFFINLHLHAMHGPLLPPPPEKYMKPFADAPERLKNFYGHLYAVDEGIRLLVEKLKATGQLRNTVIIFTSDNGASVSDMSTLPGNAPHRGQKGQYTLGGVRVPLMIYWPERIRKGRRTQELASLLDLMPTAMDAAGITIPDGLDGRSLLPLIDGAAKGPHDQLVWFGLHSRLWGFEKFMTYYSGNSQQGQLKSREPGACLVVSDDWALRFTGELEPQVYTDFPDGKAAGVELYSMKNDLGEKNNVASQYPEVVEQLKAVAARRGRELPPPNAWEKSRWEEMLHGVQP